MTDKYTLEEHLYLNALNLVSLSGPKQLATLLDHFYTAREVWEAPAEAVTAVLEVPDQPERLNKEKSSIDPLLEWEKLQNNRVRTVAFNDDHYPALLKQLNYPPPLLYFRGSIDNINRAAVAIVGSRRCTFYGQEVAGRLAAELAEAEVTVVSGMALGIDTAAHRGSLENSGYTIAVLGCGLDNCYPPQNRGLMKQIIAEGAVISEFPLGTRPLPSHFPRRNRIISGLSLGTVVVEATAKSGSLITANYALEQNREVFAVPGNIGSPYSRGSHRLLKEGARLVESAADIFEELNLELFSGEQLTLNSQSMELSDQEKTILNLIPYQPMHIDNIIRLTGTSAAETSALLLSLELKKLLRQTPGKYFCRI